VAERGVVVVVPGVAERRAPVVVAVGPLRLHRKAREHIGAGLHRGHVGAGEDFGALGRQ